MPCVLLQYGGAAAAERVHTAQRGVPETVPAHQGEAQGKPQRETVRVQVGGTSLCDDLNSKTRNSSSSGRGHNSL